MTDNETSEWAIGWTAFAGIMMILMGGWWIISGTIALLNDEFFAATGNWIFRFDVTTWGLIHLVVGIVTLGAGFYLFKGATWARTIGVIIAVVAGLTAFSWLPYYPIWAVLLIMVSVGVIYSLTALGRDVTKA